MSSFEAELAGVARDLSLGMETGAQQDWGVVWSDPARVDEFLAYVAERRTTLSSSAMAELTDLILQSAEDALEAGAPFDLEALRRFVPAADATRLQYWLDLEPTAADPWLISAQLRGWADVSERLSTRRRPEGGRRPLRPLGLVGTGR